MAELLIGPMLRYVSETEATIWLEVDSACAVEIRGHEERTFQVNGRHYAIVAVTGLEADAVVEYDVRLDGVRRWPEPGDTRPPSRIRALPRAGPVELVFGSCRVTRPHSPPYTLDVDDHELGSGVDALYAFALRILGEGDARWPHLLLLLGDQVYADEVSPETAEFIRSRRDVSRPPGLEVAGFEEYARLYREAWGQPTLRWLLATVPTAMIFDDHDVHDDWNTSAAWKATMRAEPWWPDRIAGALETYWIYQHLGNLSPAQLADDPLLCKVRAAEDGGPVLRQFALDADCEGGGGIWSYSRDLAGTRLVVLDGREGRLLEEGARQMFDDEEWRWVVERTSGDFDHLVIANTLPVLLAPTFHYLEAFNEAVCAGAWGSLAARLGERMRQGLDLEHWAAFQKSFHRLLELTREVGAGRRGSAPASILYLGGDIHQGYLQEVAFRAGAGVRSAVYQAVCSPVRNPLSRRERAMLRFGRRSTVLARALRRLAHAVGVTDPEAGWRFVQRPTFDNQIATLRFDGRRASMTIERTQPGDGDAPELEATLDRRLV
ncbi:MAG TPA: alkaline phosphatase D family protein [Solirubrobacteraceae bacterium]|nr:alkaline phosphatase D family protein [Solirubrobacteraceae bacterium]